MAKDDSVEGSNIQLLRDPDKLPDILQFLSEQQGGEFVVECTDELYAVTKAIEAHYAKWQGRAKAKGELTITIKYELDSGEYKVNCELKSKRPGAPKTQTTMWVGPGYALQRSHPGQHEMFGKPR